MLEHSSNHCSSLRSSDLDETRSLVTGVFCAHQLQLATQQDGLRYEHHFTHSPRISFHEISYGAAVHIAPQPLDSFFLIQLPLSGRDEQALGNQVLSSHPGLGSIHGPQDSFHMHWSAGCHKLVVRIEREAMERQAAHLLGAPLKQPLRFEFGMDVRSPNAKLWRQSVRQAMRGLRQGTHPLAHPLLAAQSEQLLIQSLLVWQPNTISAQLHQPAVTVLPRHIKLAEDYMRAHLDAPITNEMLAELTGVSVRTLHGGFRKFRGSSPMRYLRELRMHQVREALLDTQQPRSVTELAMRWGFAELGRFSAEYRKCFGELPSCTLRQAR